MEFVGKTFLGGALIGVVLGFGDDVLSAMALVSISDLSTAELPTGLLC